MERCIHTQGKRQVLNVEYVEGGQDASTVHRASAGNQRGELGPGHSCGSSGVIPCLELTPSPPQGEEYELFKKTSVNASGAMFAASTNTSVAAVAGIKHSPGVGVIKNFKGGRTLLE